MNYEIKTIEIPFESAKLIEFEAHSLCKIIEGTIDLNKLYGPDVVDCINRGEVATFNNCRLVITLVVLERWGGMKSMNKKHRVVLLKAGEQFQFTPNYEPVMSRRGKIRLGTVDYYLFQV